MNRLLRPNFLILAIVVCLVSPGTTYAYVDPGSAGFVITTVLGFFAAVGYLARAYIRRLKHWIFRGGRTAEKGGSRVEDSSGQ